MDDRFTALSQVAGSLAEGHVLRRERKRAAVVDERVGWVQRPCND